MPLISVIDMLQLNVINQMQSTKVRFYYGEQIGDKFKGFAYDDYPSDKADDHEQSLKKDNIDYVRIEL